MQEPYSCQRGPQRPLVGGFKSTDLRLGLSLYTPYGPCIQHPELLVNLPSTSGICHHQNLIVRIPPLPQLLLSMRDPHKGKQIICNTHGLMYVTAGPGCPLSYSHQGQDKEVLRAGDVAQLLRYLHGTLAHSPTGNGWQLNLVIPGFGK